MDKGIELAEYLCKEIAKFKLYYHNELIQFTVSIGGYERKEKTNISLKNVLRIADEALYSSKSKGKNRVTFFCELSKKMNHNQLNRTPISPFRTSNSTFEP